MARALGFKSKNEQVYDHLHSLILQGELRPGSRLVIDHLARSLGVSQIPIREALYRLQAGGFVTLEPHVGARVTELRADEVREVFMVLEAVEVISARAACEQLTDDDLARLERQVLEMGALVADAEAWSRRNKELHAFIASHARTGLVARVLEAALDHWDRLRRQYLDEVFAHRISRAQRDHVALLLALRRRDQDLVEHTVRDHNRAALAAYSDYLLARGHLADVPP